MSSTTPLTDGINALKNRINNVTGLQDSTLSDAIDSLIDVCNSSDKYTLEQINGGFDLPENLVLLGNSVRGTFYSYSSTLKTVSCPNATSVSGKNGSTQRAFSNCPNLTSVSFPSWTTNDINELMFSSCTSLVSVNFPLLSGGVASQGFLDCSSLTTIVFPKAQGTLYSSAFQGCTNLTFADFYDVYLARGAIFKNTNLTTLILRNPTRYSLANLNIFENTPFASDGSGGTLYVPSSSISEFQSVDNWSTILGYENNHILPIEGSIYETQYADGTPIPTT